MQNATNIKWVENKTTGYFRTLNDVLTPTVAIPGLPGVRVPWTSREGLDYVTR